MTRRGRVTQPILGLVAPPSLPLSPSRRELVRRAGTYLSIQQRRSLSREAIAREAQQAEMMREDRRTLNRISALLPKLGRMR